MSKTAIQFILLYLLLIAAQVIVFNHLCLFGVAVPLVFIYFIIRLPVTIGANSRLTLGFLMGLTIDIFSDTAGMNALACTLLAALKMPVLHLYFPREEDLTVPVPSMKTLGVSTYLKYSITMVVIYCTTYFIIESFTFFHIQRLLARIGGSSLLTFILIICLDSLINQQREKRL